MFVCVRARVGARERESVCADGWVAYHRVVPPLLERVHTQTHAHALRRV